MTVGQAASLPSAATPGSLLPSGGGLPAVYRIAWVALAVAAVAVLARLLLEPAMEPTILVLRLTKAAVLIAVSAILFRRRKTDRVAAMLSLAFLLWTITSSFDFSSAAIWTAALDRLRFLLFALALLLFPTGEWRPRWTRKVAFVSGAVFLIGIVEALGLVSTRLFLPLAIACVLAALAALLQRYRALGEGAEKQQLKWVAFGLVAGIGLILSARAGAAMRPSFSPVLLEGLFQSGIVVLALGFLISLLRYRLYDAEAVISRSASYAVLTLSLVATFAASEATIEMLGQRWFGPNVGNVSGAMAAAIAAVLLTPLHSRISDWAERRFQPDLILLKEQLPELLADLSVARSTRELGAAALPAICEAVHAAGAALLVGTRIAAVHGLEPGETNGQAPLRLPMRCPFGHVSGQLVLGPRPDGTPYGRDEIEALTAILPALRRALGATTQRARDLRERRSVKKRIDQISIRLDEIEAMQG